jgi:hypothetical protein
MKQRRQRVQLVSALIAVPESTLYRRLSFVIESVPRLRQQEIISRGLSKSDGSQKFD